MIHSLILAEIHFNSKLFAKDILEHPIVQEISYLIVKNNSKNNSNQSIIKIINSEYYPASSAQKRMYLSSRIADNSILYNVPFGIILNKKVDHQKFENCINKIIERHEPLRTYFETRNQDVVQKILEKVNFKLDVLENVEFENLDEIFKKFIEPFDLSKAPLFRAKLIYLTNGKSVALFDIHHIVFDGTSMTILVDELCKLYNNEALPELKISYKDFAYFEQNYTATDEFKEAENYWINQFKGELPVLSIPTTYQRPAVKSFEGKHCSLKLDQEIVDAIDYIAKKLQVTPYMILLSVYYILLSKYSSQEDIIVGTPIVGRDIAETYNLVGMFVNTLALRNTVDSSLSFKEFLSSIKNNTLESFKYQSYPFDELVNKLNLKRDSSRNALFDAMFVYQNNGAVSTTCEQLEYYNTDVDVAKFDISLEIIPQKNDLLLYLEYASSLFDTEFMENFLESYKNILETALTNIDIKISNIKFIAKKDESKILYEFNNTNFDIPDNINILDLFENNTANKPDNIAIIFEKKKVTYKELNERANLIANQLISLGITNQDTIAILLNRSIDLIASIYGVIKSGASYVLIDTALPEKRINYIIKNSNSKYCILNNKSIKEGLETKNIIDLDKYDFSIYTNTNPKVKQENNLCIIYTSGSTGEPKGVVLQKNGFLNLIFAFEKEMEISKYKNILGIATVSFDMFTVEIFCSTLFGNCLVLANEEEQKNVVAMSKLIKENNVEFFITTPSRVQMLLLEQCGNPLQNIKAFQLGGEKLNKTLYESLKQATSAKIFNGYGPTEITACCTNKFVDSKEITIGKPISNVKAYICDKNQKLLPIGIPGEICIAGAGVANGYLNNKEKTEKSFVKNPFGEGLIYKTGDLGRWLNNGEIEYLGRSDNQVKIRGLRIELDEIEKYILDYPDIQKTAVLKQTINTRDVLSAYFVASKKININELRKYLSSHLPKYMVPSYFTPLEDFPYTANRKS